MNDLLLRVPSRQSTSNRCASRRMFLTFVFIAVYIKYEFSVKRTLSFAWTTRPRQSQRHSNPKANVRNNHWHLNAIALPQNPTSTTASISSIELNGLSAAAVEPQKQSQPNVGVLLLNLGGPETGDDVEGTIVIDQPVAAAHELLE